MNKPTRRKFLGTIGATTAIGIAGCSSETATDSEVEWEETGLLTSGTDTVKTVSAFVVGRNTSEKKRHILVDIRVAREDGTLLTDWRHAEIEDVPAGDKAMLEETFEVSRSSWFSSNEPTAVEESAVILFRQKKDYHAEDGKPALYMEEGEVKRFNPE